MTPSVTSNSLQCKTKIKPQGQKPSSPVKPHLSIEGDLVSAADEAELLAAHVVGGPRACVWIVRACSVRFAELPFRDVFAAAVILTNIFLQMRKSLHFAFVHETDICPYQITVGANKVFVNPKYGSASLGAHTSVGKPAGPVIDVHGSSFRSHLGMFPNASPTLLHSSPGAGEKNHLKVSYAKSR